MTLRTLSLLAVICIALLGCAQQLICPAYQSSFIHDKEALRKKFSYFVNDSTPKVYTASKTKYLIAVPESYKKRYRKMQTVELRPVQPVVPDSLSEAGRIVQADSLANLLANDSLGRTKIDTLTQQNKIDSTKTSSEDSVYVITKDKEVRILRYNFPDSLHYDSATGKYLKEKPYYYVTEVGYNVEQENYMWYFRKQLILPDVRLGKQAEATKATEAKAAKKKGFFKRLMFWKKNKKQKTDSLQVKPQALDPNDSIFYTDSSSIKKTPSTVVAPKKKGVLSKLKKKDKPAPSTDPKSPAKKEEDGF